MVVLVRDRLVPVEPAPGRHCRQRARVAVLGRDEPHHILAGPRLAPDVIAPNTTDFHDVNVEGKSGIFATCGRDPRPRWVSSRRRLEWPNGAMCVFFSGEEPESLRGPEAEMVIVDEIARMRYQQSVFDTMMLGLRLGDRPRVLIATTPRTTPFMKKLVAMDDVRITTGSTYDNAAHLS